MWNFLKNVIWKPINIFTYTFNYPTMYFFYIVLLFLNDLCDILILYYMYLHKVNIFIIFLVVLRSYR